jgi:hypothetical protein
MANVPPLPSSASHVHSQSTQPQLPSSESQSQSQSRISATATAPSLKYTPNQLLPHVQQPHSSSFLQSSPHSTSPKDSRYLASFSALKFPLHFNPHWCHSLSVHAFHCYCDTDIIPLICTRLSDDPAFAQSLRACTNRYSCLLELLARRPDVQQKVHHPRLLPLLPLVSARGRLPTLVLRYPQRPNDTKTKRSPLPADLRDKRQQLHLSSLPCSLLASGPLVRNPRRRARQCPTMGTTWSLRNPISLQ